MHAPRSAPDADNHASDHRRGAAPSVLAIALPVLADTGYGLWALEGIALACGIFRHGRGESLVPLAVGLVFVIAGLAVASLRKPDLPAWHGWRPGRNAWPPRGALLALASFLPVLAVAGLTRGDNDFWATRLAGAVLTLCSLGCLLQSAPRWSMPAAGASGAAAPHVGRLMAALYGGGLWLWLLAAADRPPTLGAAPPQHQPWLLALLVMALLLGLMEGMRWHALRLLDATDVSTPRGGIIPARFAAALLGYAVPCVALLLADRWQASGALALLAAVSALVGRVLEQRLYTRANGA